ncbi:MAG: RNA polymerase sigma factor [Pirellulales bacterium]
MTTGRDIASLIRKHQAGVWRYLRMLGCDAATADEFTQETFLTILQQPFADYHPSATAGYLRKTARNLLVTAQRKLARSVPLTDWDAVDADWDRWGASDNGEAMLVALDDCLKVLTDKSRKALKLKYREDQTRAAIAANLGLSEDGAKNLLQRAKQQLRECIERKLP